MKRAILLSAVLLLASSALGQFTVVTGTVTDPNGIPYANGTIVGSLVSSGTPKFTATGTLYVIPTQATGLSGNGSFVVSLADNTFLSPGGTQWNFTVCSYQGSVNPAFGKGSVCFTAGPLTISGATQNITSTLNAAALALTVPISGGSSCGSGSTNSFMLWTAPTTCGVAPLVTNGTNRITSSQHVWILPGTAADNTGALRMSTTYNTGTGFCNGGGWPQTISCYGSHIDSSPPSDTTGFPVGSDNEVTTAGSLTGSPTGVAGVLAQSTVSITGGTEPWAVGVSGIAAQGGGGSNGGTVTDFGGVLGQAIAGVGGGNTTITTAFGTGGVISGAVGTVGAAWALLGFSPNPGTAAVPTGGGLLIQDQTVGNITNPFAIQTLGTAPSTFGGSITATGGVSTASSLDTCGPLPWVSVTCTTYAADRTGATDSTAKLNSAITATCGAGLTLFFPPGTYLASTATSNHILSIANAGNCTLFAYPGTVTLKKGVSASQGLINISSSSGSIVIDGLGINGNQAGGFTGPCIQNGTTIALTIKNTTMTGCDQNSIYLTGNTGAAAGPIRIEKNNITTGTGNTGQGAAIGVTGDNITGFEIEGNTFNCSALATAISCNVIHNSDTPGQNTAVTKLRIINNDYCSGPNWDLEAGTFAGFGMTDVTITGNHFQTCVAAGGGISLEGLFNFVVGTNVFDANGFSRYELSMTELPSSTGGTVSNNTYYTEANDGTHGMDAIHCDNCNDVKMVGNNIYGLNENGTTGSEGISIQPTNNTGTVSTISETGTTLSFTMTAALGGHIFPNATVSLYGGTAPLQTCLVLNSGYSRTGGTFQCNITTTGLTTGAFTTVATSASRNTAEANHFFYPQNTLTSNIYGIQVRGSGVAGVGIVDGNLLTNNIFAGTLNTASELGISFQGVGQEMVNNVSQGNIFNNVFRGISVTAGTNITLVNDTFANVGTKLVDSQAGSLIENMDAPIPFAEYAACAAAIDGNIGWVSDNNTAVAFAATVTGGGAGATGDVSMRCNGAGTKWTITGN